MTGLPASGNQGREPGFAGSRYLIPDLPMPAIPMLSALDLARRIEAGELTPRAVVDICAEAIAARDKEVGAFVVLDLVAARQAADNPKLAATPLRGLAVGFKDIFDTADFPTQYGSPIYAGFQPAPMPRRWR